MAAVVNEMGGRRMQRAILTSLVVTFLASLLMIPVALGPIGYSPGRATLEILVYGSVLVLLFILLCCDCCAKKFKDDEYVSLGAKNSGPYLSRWLLICSFPDH